MTIGRMIVFEGLDGSGKTSQRDAVSRWLDQQGIPHRCLREPGGTQYGELMRAAVLTPGIKVGQIAELFGFLAARAQLIHEVVVPAMRAGETILMDRFWHSTLAYQVYGRELVQHLPQIEDAIELSLAELTPINFRNQLLYFKVSPETSARRIAVSRGKDRMESGGLAFSQRVADGYELIMRRCHHVEFDTEQGDLDEITRQVIDVIRPGFEWQSSPQGQGVPAP